MAGKYTLNIGCWRGTLASRDSEQRKFDTLEEAKQSIEDSVLLWRRIGYYLWFAEIKSPEGEVLLRR